MRPRHFSRRNVVLAKQLEAKSGIPEIASSV